MVFLVGAYRNNALSSDFSYLVKEVKKGKCRNGEWITIFWCQKEAAREQDTGSM